MRAGMSYFHEIIWKGVPKFLRRVGPAFKNIGINERIPYNTPHIQFPSWMGGDRDGNPRVTPEVTRDVCLLARMMAANICPCGIVVTNFVFVPKNSIAHLQREMSNTT